MNISGFPAEDGKVVEHIFLSEQTKFWGENLQKCFKLQLKWAQSTEHWAQNLDVVRAEHTLLKLLGFKERSFLVVENKKFMWHILHKN